MTNAENGELGLFLYQGVYGQFFMPLHIHDTPPIKTRSPCFLPSGCFVNYFGQQGVRGVTLCQCGVSVLGDQKAPVILL